MKEKTGVYARYNFTALDADGNELWQEEFTNLMPDAGLTDLLQNYFKGAGYTASLYLGLTAADPVPAADDTMLLHPGWTEVVAYDSATRPILLLNDAFANQIDNVGQEISYTVTVNDTGFGGAFIVTDGVKGGTGGLLVSVGAFTRGNKLLDDQDNLVVDVTITATSA